MGVKVNEAGEARKPNVLGQKARTVSEERATWVRRFDRWYGKAVAVLGKAEADAIVAAGPKAGTAATGDDL